ncbi:MAG: imidazole glycerol phosphate synthase subunit HisH [Flavobacteriales bacterium]|nr:imidazole glycerol phosphate synthase subunit HisH [Flavobacteriales bacterium]
MIAVVKYNAGNIRSVMNALHRLGADATVTDDPVLLRKADKVIFPGVGEASSAMRYLRDRGLDEVLKNLNQPFLGICLGLQLMCKHSEEGDTDCLGIFTENVKRFPSGKVNVPHMGWNNCNELKGPLFEVSTPSPLRGTPPFKGESLLSERTLDQGASSPPSERRGVPQGRGGYFENSDFYFVHSYYAELGSQTTAKCEYILPFSAALQKDNFHAVQFHPEKSADVGQKLIKNFLEL